VTKAVASRALAMAALAGGFVAAMYAARALSGPLNVALGRVFARTLPWLNLSGTWWRQSAPLALLGCLALLFIAVYRLAPGRRASRLARLDAGVVVAGAWSLLVLCLEAGLKVNLAPPLVLVLAILAYVVLVAGVVEIAGRSRDRSAEPEAGWRPFFVSQPPSGPVGLAMAFLLAIDLFYLVILAGYQVSVRPLIWLYGYNVQMSPEPDEFKSMVILGPNLSLPLFLLAFAVFCALTTLRTFVLVRSRQYEAANAEALRAERFKAELITNVSHDIRTPLTSIITYVGLLRDLPVERPEFRDYVTVLERKSARLNTLIDDLMEASKAASGNLPVTLRDVDLAEIVGQAAGEFDDQFTERGLTLVLRAPDSQTLVRADSDHLWRVLENLFGNAAKYALRGTRVFAEIGRRGGRTAFVLKNTSQDPIESSGASLTEQFIRGDQARHTDGHGLGLYIAKSLVELMGGRFTVRADGDLFQAEIVFPGGSERP